MGKTEKLFECGKSETSSTAIKAKGSKNASNAQSFEIDGSIDYLYLLLTTIPMGNDYTITLDFPNICPNQFKNCNSQFGKKKKFLPL